MQTLKNAFPQIEQLLVEDFLIYMSAGLVFGVTAISVVKFMNSRKIGQGLLRKLGLSSARIGADGGLFGGCGETFGDMTTPKCTYQCTCCRIQKKTPTKKPLDINHDTCLEDTPEGEEGCLWKNFEVWSFYCPISNQLIEDPVISKYGHIYNRKSIQEWIKIKGICPFSYQKLTNDDLIPIYSLKADIYEYKKRIRSLQEKQKQLEQEQQEKLKSSSNESILKAEEDGKSAEISSISPLSRSTQQ
eukprot:403339400